jgi:CPA2 family monovalent cation:H+ antiporter-2
MTESVLRVLGAAPEQIDRERERVRTDLFGEAADDNRDRSPLPRHDRSA